MPGKAVKETRARYRTRPPWVSAFSNRRRFTVPEYYAMAEIGVLEHDRFYELIDGDVIEATATGGRQLKRFTTSEYFAMAEAGIFRPDERLELIDGEILIMSPVNAPHASEVKRLNRLFTEQLGDKALVGVQDPVRLGDIYAPQPDIALLRMREDFYRTEHPTAGDALLLVEVSDSTLKFDRDTKLPQYARHGIREVWIVNLQRRQLEVYRQPGVAGYKERQVLKTGDEIMPLALPDVTFKVSDILG